MLCLADINISQNGKSLDLSVTNDGTEIVSTLQMKLSYLNSENRLIWVEPFYLQNNLIPGETRQISVPLTSMVRPSNIPADSIEINGHARNINSKPLWPAGVKIPDGEGQILIDYDAMIYRPLD